MPQSIVLQCIRLCPKMVPIGCLWEFASRVNTSVNTDPWVNKGTVYQLSCGGRARWRIENETFNTLENQGHFEHNFGHGYQHLSVVFAVLMMLAFLVDRVQQLCCPLFQAVWAKLGSKRRLWEKMRPVLCVCPDLHATSVRSPVVWLAEDGPHPGRFLLNVPGWHR